MDTSADTDTHAQQRRSAGEAIRPPHSRLLVVFHINKRNVPRMEKHKQAVDSRQSSDTCVPGRGLQEMFAHFRTQLKWSGHKSIFEFALKPNNGHKGDADMGPCILPGSVYK